MGVFYVGKLKKSLVLGKFFNNYPENLTIYSNLLKKE